MVWEHSGRMHWTSHDVVGLMLDIRIVKGSTIYQVINAETGEIIKTKEYGHPKEAMEDAKQELAHAEYEKERQTAASQSPSPIAEASGAI